MSGSCNCGPVCKYYEDKILIELIKASTGLNTVVQRNFI